MNRLFIYKALNRLNEDIILNFASKNDVEMNYYEAYVALCYMRDKTDQILDDPEIIFKDFQEPVATKYYSLLMILKRKFSFLL